MMQKTHLIHPTFFVPKLLMGNGLNIISNNRGDNIRDYCNNNRDDNTHCNHYNMDDYSNILADIHNQAELSPHNR